MSQPFNTNDTNTGSSNTSNRYQPALISKVPRVYFIKLPISYAFLKSKNKLLYGLTMSTIFKEREVRDNVENMQNAIANK